MANKVHNCSSSTQRSASSFVTGATFIHLELPLLTVVTPLYLLNQPHKLCTVQPQLDSGKPPYRHKIRITLIKPPPHSDATQNQDLHLSRTNAPETLFPNPTPCSTQALPKAPSSHNQLLIKTSIACSPEPQTSHEPRHTPPDLLPQPPQLPKSQLRRTHEPHNRTPSAWVFQRQRPLLEKTPPQSPFCSKPLHPAFSSSGPPWLTSITPCP